MSASTVPKGIPHTAPAAILNALSSCDMVACTAAPTNAAAAKAVPFDCQPVSYLPPCPDDTHALASYNQSCAAAALAFLATPPSDTLGSSPRSRRPSAALTSATNDSAPVSRSSSSRSLQTRHGQYRMPTCYASSPGQPVASPPSDSSAACRPSGRCATGLLQPSLLKPTVLHLESNSAVPQPTSSQLSPMHSPHRSNVPSSVAAGLYEASAGVPHQRHSYHHPLNKSPTPPQQDDDERSPIREGFSLDRHFDESILSYSSAFSDCEEEERGNQLVPSFARTPIVSRIMSHVETSAGGDHYTPIIEVLSELGEVEEVLTPNSSVARASRRLPTVGIDAGHFASGGRVALANQGNAAGWRGLLRPAVNGHFPESFLAAAPVESREWRDGAVPTTAASAGKNAFRHTSHIQKRRVGGGKKGPVYMNDYLVTHMIGEGACGRVWLAYDTANERKVAIKGVSRPRYPKDRFGRGGTENAKFEAFEKEVSVMQTLRHKNIVSVYEVIDDPKQDAVYLVMKYISRGPISQSHSADHNGHIYDPIPPAKLANYAREVLAGLEYLHRHKVVHRDIKPENILIDDNEHVYLADFGVAETLDQDYRARLERQMQQSLAMSQAMSIRGERLEGSMIVGLKGTVLYLAPELWRGNCKAEPVDMWAMGVTLYTLLIGRLPFQSPEDCMTTVPPIPEHLGPLWRDLIYGMLEREPSRRLTAHAARAQVKRIIEDEKLHAPVDPSATLLRLQREAAAKGIAPALLRQNTRALTKAASARAAVAEKEKAARLAPQATPTGTDCDEAAEPSQTSGPDDTKELPQFVTPVKLNPQSASESSGSSPSPLFRGSSTCGAGGDSSIHLGGQGSNGVTASLSTRTAPYESPSALPALPLTDSSSPSPAKAPHRPCRGRRRAGRSQTQHEAGAARGVGRDTVQTELLEPQCPSAARPPCASPRSSPSHSPPRVSCDGGTAPPLVLDPHRPTTPTAVKPPKPRVAFDVAVTRPHGPLMPPTVALTRHSGQPSPLDSDAVLRGNDSVSHAMPDSRRDRDGTTGGIHEVMTPPTKGPVSFLGVVARTQKLPTDVVAWMTDSKTDAGRACTPDHRGSSRHASCAVACPDVATPLLFNSSSREDSMAGPLSSQTMRPPCSRSAWNLTLSSEPSSRQGSPELGDDAPSGVSFSPALHAANNHSGTDVNAPFSRV